MRAMPLAFAATLVACYQPSPPEGAPCSPSGKCPSAFICDRGLCVRMARDAGELPGDASDPDGPVDGNTGGDAAIDATMPTSATFGPGVHTFTAPPGCTRIRVRAWGGGGGGGGDGGGGSGIMQGGDGGASTLGDLRANGGEGGAHGGPGLYLGGDGGTAMGGTVNLAGEDGGNGAPATVVGTSGAGGASPNGGDGGPSIATAATNGNPGTIPGGGGSGGQALYSPAAGGGGGGYVETMLDIQSGIDLPLTVGAGGPGGGGTSTGGAGADGRIVVMCE